MNFCANSVVFLNAFIVYLNVFIVPIRAKETFNPDESLTVPKIIKRYAYPSETHIVDTNDGYLLEVHRIPHGKSTKQYRNFPVFLQHGLLTSSADWVINGPTRSLAYLLADRGFDVWLGNSRGNTYSRSHKYISTHSEQFWNFSFHEMGLYDLPATIDYILEHTNSTQLYYVGHSMGTCMFYVMCSMHPEYNHKIRAQISLAPIAYVHHMKFMLNSLVPYANQIQKVTTWISQGVILSHNTISTFMNKYLCEKINSLCKKYIIYKLIGEDSDKFDMKLLPIILAHNPAATSVKTILHFAQEIIAKNFQQFDYGPAENIKVYNCLHPPKYNLSNIITPVAFYYAKNDILADPNDVMELYTQLPHRLGLHLINEFNHGDFLYGYNVYDMLYQNVINTIYTAEFDDWLPVYDNTTLFKDLNNETLCNDTEIRERASRKKNDSFWSKLISYNIFK